MKQIGGLLVFYLFIYVSATRPRRTKDQTFCQNVKTVGLNSLGLTVGNF